MECNHLAALHVDDSRTGIAPQSRTVMSDGVDRVLETPNPLARSEFPRMQALHKIGPLEDAVLQVEIVAIVSSRVTNDAHVPVQQSLRWLDCKRERHRLS